MQAALRLRLRVQSVGTAQGIARLPEGLALASLRGHSRSAKDSVDVPSADFPNDAEIQGKTLSMFIKPQLNIVRNSIKRLIENKIMDRVVQGHKKTGPVFRGCCASLVQ